MKQSGLVTFFFEHLSRTSLATRSVWACVIVCSMFFCPSWGFCTVYQGNCFLTFGNLKTSESFSEAFNVSTKKEAGVSFDVKAESWPVSVDLQMSYLYAKSRVPSIPENKKMTVLRSDTGIGIKKIFHMSESLKPFVGGGPYLVRMYSELAGETDMSTGIGYYFVVGVYCKITKNFSTGLHWKRSVVDCSIQHSNVDSGGEHLAFLAGFSF